MVVGDEMDAREPWLRIMNHEEVDRIPVFHYGVWPETLRRWHREGLPRDVGLSDFPAVPPKAAFIRGENGLFPPFEPEIFEETAAWVIARQPDGVLSRQWKERSGPPHVEEFLLRDQSGWEQYRRRLQPDPQRVPEDLDQRARAARAAGGPVCIMVGSTFGWLRDWMGVEGLALMCYDNRDLVREMIDTVTDLQCWWIEQILGRHSVDLAWGWEDICFRSGPIVSPDIYRECALPSYLKISAKLREYGVQHFLVDCDGCVDELIPVWLDGGVDIVYPFEIGVWEADAARTLSRFGRNLRIYGGINKLEIAGGPGAIDRELARVAPMMRSGAFCPLPDHNIVPGTSLADYRYYLAKLSEIRL